MIPTMWHSGKGNTRRDSENYQRARGREGRLEAAPGIFKVVKPFHMWCCNGGWTPHVCQNQENLQQSEPWYQLRNLSSNNVPIPAHHLWQMYHTDARCQWRETGGGGTWQTGTPHFLLHFSVNLKLLQKSRLINLQKKYSSELHINTLIFKIVIIFSKIKIRNTPNIVI